MPEITKAVGWSTTQFLTILGVLLTKTTIRDVLLFPSPAINTWWVHKRLHEFISIFMNYMVHDIMFVLSLFLTTTGVNSFFLPCKCIFINKDWEKSNQNSLWSYNLLYIFVATNQYVVLFKVLTFWRVLLTEVCYCSPLYGILIILRGMVMKMI